MDPAWIPCVKWIFSLCPRLFRYSAALIAYLRKTRSSSRRNADDIKYMEQFLKATMAVLKELKRCGAHEALIQAALAEVVALVQLQLEAMKLRQQLALAELMAKLAQWPGRTEASRVMPVVATAVLVINPGPVANGPVAEAPIAERVDASSVANFAGSAELMEPVISVQAATYEGVERRKHC